MASNPDLSRRPAVDASIVQADTVRGYDAPNASQQECDLIVSNGRNAGTGAVSDILISNRTDDTDQPMFILVPGADITTGDRFEVYSGTIVDPTGVLTSPLGSLYVSNNPPALWQNQDGATDWKKISDDLGGENLEETLMIGNTSGPFDIILSKTPGGPLTAAALLGESISDGTQGGDLLLSAGEATGATGDGGDVLIASGSSLNANTGAFTAGSFTASAAGGASGAVTLQSGNSLAGPSGDMIIGTGLADGDSGDILFATGASTTGSGGDIVMGAFGGPTGGGNVLIGAGTPVTASNVKGGDVTVLGGAGAGTGIGGQLFLQAGNGGPGGGLGGSIFLTPGTSTNPTLDGRVIANGLFLAENYQRNNADPNTLGLTSDEGYVFQDSTSGDGALWVNTNGSTTGWRKLAFAADFVNSFTRLSYGTATPSGENTGLNPQDDFSDFGLYEGAQITVIGGGASDRLADEYGPHILFSNANLGQGAGWQINSAGNTSSFQRRQRFLAVFKFASTADISTQRIVIGFTTSDLPTHLANNNPAGQYFILRNPAPGNSWEFFTQGPGGSLTQSLGSVTSAGINVPLYVVFDLSDPNIIRCQFLDESFDLIAEQTLEAPNLNLGPSSNTALFPIFGVSSNAAQASSLKFYSANVVIEADQILSASGLNSNPTLEQVLIAGNLTGSNPIVINSNSSSIQTADGTDGINMLQFTGLPTTPTGQSGDLTLITGQITDAGNTGQTGNVLIGSGFHLGSGSSGSVGIIAGTGPLGSGGITLQIGSGSTTGVPAADIRLLGQNVDGAGDTGGNIDIQAGDFNSALTGVSGSVLIQSGLNGGDGITGGVSIQTPPSVNGQGGNILIQANIAENDGGEIEIVSGSSNNGQGGAISVTTGSSFFGAGNGGNFSLTTGDGGQGGSVNVQVGASSTGPGGSIAMIAGSSATDVGGSILLNPGLGALGDGEVIVNGKLTVTGLIDPTGLVLVAQGALPYAPAVGEGVIYVDSTSDELFYTNSTTTINLSNSGGGGSSTLAGLTDVSLGALSAGDNLQYNGAFWTNVPSAGVPGSLASVLATGNVTGANALIISDDPAAFIQGEDTAGGNAGALLIRGGDVTAGSGQGGDVNINGGDSADMVDGGNVNIQGGAAGVNGGTGGVATLRGGVGTTTNPGGNVEISGGIGGAGGGDGGDVVIDPGVGQGGGVAGTIQMGGDTFITGDLDVTGKLTVAGLIDPTGLVLNAQLAAPTVPAGNDGLIYVNASGEFILNSTAGAVNLNSIAAGAGDLQTVIGNGGTTGAQNLELSTGGTFLFNTNVSVPGGLPAVGNGKLWMNSSDELVFSNSGGDTVLGAGASGQDLSAVLSVGDGTGPNVITVQNAQGLRSQPSAYYSIEGGTADGTTTAAPFAGYNLANALAGGVYLLGGLAATTTDGTGPLELITADAQTTGGADNGATGGIIRLATGAGGDAGGTGDGGVGGPLSLRTGDGGDSASNLGGAGGFFSFQAGTGGSTTTAQGGAGGFISLSAGAGGDNNDAVASAGEGGSVSIIAGSGGTNAGAGDNGNYGDLNLVGANAPANPFTALPSNRGGMVYLAAGTVGAGATPALMTLTPNGEFADTGGALIALGGDAGPASNRSGGDITMNGGTGDGSGGGGDVTFSGGTADSGSGGGIELTGGESTSGAGGTIEITGGESSAAGALGGNVILRSGPSADTRGYVLMSADSSTPALNPGMVALRGRTDSTRQGGFVNVFAGGGAFTGAVAIGAGSGSTTEEGGEVNINGGDIGTYTPPINFANPGTGGLVRVRGGAGDSTGIGGNAILEGGLSGTTGGAGGGAIIQGGSGRGGSNANGGSVTIRGGVADGAGTNGTLTLGRDNALNVVQGTLDNANSTMIQRGTVFMGAAFATLTVNFANTMNGTPTVIITPERNLAAVAANYSIDSVSSTSFQVRRSAAGVAVFIHYIAMV